MKKFLLLHVGFEQPTEEVMNAWMAWFESIADKQVEQVGLMNGREINKDGTRDLPWDGEALTGYNVIEAESMAEAEALAASCPFITAIRVYELR